jgi:HAD superfamily hydrolase (TIGR01450 family)
MENPALRRLAAARLFLLDMDGTLYLGDSIIDGAFDFIEAIRSTGRDFIYLTNNSSRAAGDYVARMRSLGFPCGEENVFTAGMATGLYLCAHYAGKRVYLVGTEAFRKELLSYEVNLCEQDADVVVVGFDRELTYEKLEKATDFLREGAVFLAANMDLVCPMDGGRVLPDCGSICALLTSATGREPKYLGKPDRAMVDILSKERGIPNGRIAVVGDRLYTDIAVGINAGAVSVCVLSGESSQEDINSSKYIPDIIFPSVKEIGEYLLSCGSVLSDDSTQK